MLVCCKFDSQEYHISSGFVQVLVCPLVCAASTNHRQQSVLNLMPKSARYHKPSNVDMFVELLPICKDEATAAVTALMAGHMVTILGCLLPGWLAGKRHQRAAQNKTPSTES